jgi:hypothetical protein
MKKNQKIKPEKTFPAQGLYPWPGFPAGHCAFLFSLTITSLRGTKQSLHDRKCTISCRLVNPIALGLACPAHFDRVT